MWILKKKCIYDNVKEWNLVLFIIINYIIIVRRFTFSL